MFRLFVAVILCAGGICRAALVYTVAQMQLPTENSGDTTRFTTPRAPAETGNGGLSPGRAIWNGTTENMSVLWRPDGTGIDLYAHAFHGGSSATSPSVNSVAMGINSKGEVAMSVNTSLYIAFRPNPVTQPNRWQNKLVASNAFASSPRFNFYDFNTAGEIVLADTTGFAYHFSPTGTRTAIPFFPDAINDAGTFIGAGNRFGRVTGGAGAFGTFPTPNGFTGVTVFDINNAGLVVGRATSAGGNRPFVYSPASDTYTFLTIPVGYASGSAISINSDGVVVGAVTLPDNSASQPIIWRNGIPTLLKDVATFPAGMTSGTANEISDDGYIFIEGRGGGSLYPLFLTVPEPAGLPLLIGVAILAVRRRIAARQIRH